MSAALGGGLAMQFFRKRRPRAGAPPGGPSEPSDNERRLRIVRAYHEQTKHGFQRYAAGPLELDWATQPDPFRRYLGAELIELELEGDERAAQGPRYDRALEQGALPAAALEPSSLSRLFFDSLALSAWKQAGAARWALRVNPSSGNLHPTEAYLLAPSVPGLNAQPSVLHYAPLEHALELRAELPADLWARLSADHPGALFVGLTSIAWREAWKYGERAYRYVQHDAGHAIAALAVAAAGLGWRVELADQLASEELDVLLGVEGSRGPERERATCLLAVRTTPAASSREFAPAPEVVAAFRELAWRGRPNDLSPAHVEWEAVDLAFEAAAKPRGAAPGGLPAESGPRSPVRAEPVREEIALRSVLRARRSCLALDGRTPMARADFFRVLEAVLPRAGRVPFASFAAAARLDLAIFVHRVEGLPQGLYWLARDPARLERARAACRAEFLWERPPECPAELPLALLLPLDLRRHATEVSCGQAIAGGGAFSLGMIADFAGPLGEHGAWLYPRLFWEAGAIGQRLYLELEALGLGGTGIGCYLDDPMHSILGFADRSFQSLYHFTAGMPVPDERLKTEPAYARRPRPRGQPG